MKKSGKDYKKMIKTYRKQLAKAEKRLNQLEMAIQIDRDYDRKLRRLGKKLPKGHRTISGLNKLRVSKVKTSSCRVREFPNSKGSIVGSYSAGKKVDARYHNSKWYTVVYGGEKAFMNRKCFM